MIYVVIPVHNRKVFTLGCLACLARQTVADHRVIVVDDGSTDGTGEQVRKQFPASTVVTGTGSLWWAGATNVGIRYVFDTFSPRADDFILTLNDDIQINPDYLATLLLASQANKGCIIGSISVDVNEPHKLLYAGTRHNLLLPHIDNWAYSRYRHTYEALPSASPYFPSDTLPGRGMLIPVPVFNTIGMLDEQRFRHHMADIDFSISARQAGFPLIISSVSVIYEYSEATGVNLTKSMSLRQFVEALRSIRSPINYRVRYQFARKHSPLGVGYFGLDMLRILGGYVIRRVKARLRQ
ncbi:glycosyltransferase family 2 protein [Spirosoma rigui]|uniref:glycosyltransferase family 2 protein n=1 Tax=Spirosoma rigui TaxID=564064 RepID=UPI0009B0DB88|nr:glycosyltransferase family 2 protein [Spirosoma rigui]